MKLSPKQIPHAAGQISARVIPEDHPLVPRLSKVYGDHTFFLDEDGLEIIEAAPERNERNASAQVVNLADWADEQRTSLALHEPEPTSMVVELADDASKTEE